MPSLLSHVPAPGAPLDLVNVAALEALARLLDCASNARRFFVQAGAVPSLVALMQPAGGPAGCSAVDGQALEAAVSAIWFLSRAEGAHPTLCKSGALPILLSLASSGVDAAAAAVRNIAHSPTGRTALLKEPTIWDVLRKLLADIPDMSAYPDTPPELIAVPATAEDAAVACWKLAEDGPMGAAAVLGSGLVPSLMRAVRIAPVRPRAAGAAARAVACLSSTTAGLDALRANGAAMALRSLADSSSDAELATREAAATAIQRLNATTVSLGPTTTVAASPERPLAGAPSGSPAGRSGVPSPGGSSAGASTPPPPSPQPPAALSATASTPVLEQVVGLLALLQDPVQQLGAAEELAATFSRCDAAQCDGAVTAGSVSALVRVMAAGADSVASGERTARSQRNMSVMSAALAALARLCDVSSAARKAALAAGVAAPLASACALAYSLLAAALNLRGLRGCFCSDLGPPRTAQSFCFCPLVPQACSRLASTPSAPQTQPRRCAGALSPVVSLRRRRQRQRRLSP